MFQETWEGLGDLQLEGTGAGDPQHMHLTQKDADAQLQVSPVRAVSASFLL